VCRTGCTSSRSTFGYCPSQGALRESDGKETRSFAVIPRNPSASDKHVHPSISAEYEGSFPSQVPPSHREGQSHILQDSSPGV